MEAPKLQILRDGTFCRQYAQMQQWCKRVEGEREAMEQQLMRVEGERIKEQIAAVVERAAGRTASESADENRAEASKERQEGTGARAPPNRARQSLPDSP